MAAITEPISIKSPIKVSKRVERELHQTKVVIRRLPPDFTREKLLESMPTLPDHYFFYFSPGDPTAGILGCSRAYIGFSNEEDIPPFHAHYDGRMFESEKGTKYRAVIEFAPYQGVPKKLKRKPDTRCGTIEQDTDYKAFLESLETKPEPLTGVELTSYLEGASGSKTPEDQTTPLIEYLRDRRSRSRGRGRGSSVDVRKKKGDSSSKSKAASKSSKQDKDASKSSKSKGSSRSRHDSKPHDEPKYHSNRSTSSSSSVSANHTGSDTVATTTSAEGGGGRRTPGDKEKVVQNGDIREGRDSKSGRRERRNRDRPDRAIYMPRNRSSDQLSGSPGGRSNPKEYDGRPRDGGETSQSRSKPHSDKSSPSNHRFYDRDRRDEYQQRDHGGGRGDRERTYDDTKEFKKKPRERYRSGGGGRGRGDGQYQGGRSSRGGGERKKYSESEFHDR